MSGPRSRDAAALIGRDAECRRIEALLAAARLGCSGALVLCGEPGIGKSALCAWATAHAPGSQVCSIRGVESEVDLPFAGLSELCAGDHDRLRLLPDPQARALDAALARRDAPPGDRFAIGAALLSFLAVAAEDDPLVVVVDDAQWLDAASADALSFAARRLSGERVALLVATRPGGLFDTESSGLPRLALTGLDSTAAKALLAAAHGALPDPVATLLSDRSQGNPLALLEIPLTLTREQLAGQEQIDEPLLVGPSLRRALLDRVSGLDADTRRALVVAAATGGERAQPVVDALAALGLDRRILEPAEETGVLSLAGEHFEFRHPLLRSAIYHGAPGPAKRAAHAALATVTNGDVRAWHLAHATVGENEEVAATLEEVGLEARRRGAPVAASSAMQRAAGLSPPGPQRARRLTEAARDFHIAGRPTAALRLLDAALAGAPDAVQRADIQHLRGRILVLQGQVDTAFRLLVEEAERIRDIDAERAATMLADACMDRIVSADVAGALRVARDALRFAERGSPAVQAFAGVMLAVALVVSGDRGEGGAMLDRFLPALRVADPLTESGELVSVAAQCCFWLDRVDMASKLLDRLTAAARAASAPAALLQPLCCRAELDLRLGRWTIATAQLEEAADLGEEMSEAVFAAYAPECLARLSAAAGDEDRCREHAAHATRLIEAHDNQLGRLYVSSALGLLELGLGRIEPAIHHLELARALARRAGIAEPNVVHWQADLIEAYVRAGDIDAAWEELAVLGRQAEHTGGRWALGTAARGRALLADPAELDQRFAEALVHLGATGDPFERARTHLCHGERLRRSGRRRDARRALAEAIDGFEALGAAPWLDRARAEFSATGARPRRRRPRSDPDQLTPHEVQVALVVARGASNREAAAALFLSPKTIEFHLANIYRKLGLRRRAELTGVAARRGWLDDRAPLADSQALGKSPARSATGLP